MGSAKRRSKRFRQLREELHYWQGQARMEARWLRKTRTICKTLGKEMQNEIKSKS
jgi:hypothetical protein